MEKLFLLKADFSDQRRGEGVKFFCPDCALIEGILSYYPGVREKIDVHYVDYTRPRKVLVDLLGEENQSCPVLVRGDGTFINDPDLIVEHLTKNYSVGVRH